MKEKLLSYILIGGMISTMTLSAIIAYADQSANCGITGTCYWFGGNGNFSQVNNWSTRSDYKDPCFCYPNGPVSVVLDAKSTHLVLTQDVPVLVTGQVSLIGDVTVKIANDTTWYILGPFIINSGEGTPGGFTMNQIWDYMRLLLFASFIIFGLIFAFKIKSHRSGGHRK